MEAEGNSSSCIQAQTCYPLGGSSIWAAVPPYRDPSTQSPYILVIAGADSSGLFHNLIQAADAPLSGLIAMMAAAEALGGTAASERYQRRIVFAALRGEPWGLMGSRRLLWEMNVNASSAVSGLGLHNLDALIEIGPVGASRPVANVTTLYAHSDAEPEAAKAAAPLIAALQNAANASSSSSSEFSSNYLVVDMPDPSTPGISSPSSASAFLRVRPTLPAVVLAEYNTQFINPAYASQYDTVDKVSPESITATAVLLARTLHGLALNGSDAADEPLDVNATAVQATVEALLGCLASNEPGQGMGCSLANQIMTPSASGPPPGYIGILRTLTAGR